MNQSSNEQSPKIFIGGSSWARGEWQGPEVAHRGITQYLSDSGYTVVDASQARSYHSRAIQNLQKHLDQHYRPKDIILFVMADPLLDLIMPELAKLKIKRSDQVKNLEQFSNEIKLAGGVVALIRKLQDQIYNQLDLVACQFDTTIYCIGGTYNVNTNISKHYQNLYPLVVSWINLLIGHFQEHAGVDHPEFGISYTWGLDYIDLSKFDQTFAEQVKQEINLISDRTGILKELIFHPDGLHPNREGHKILFEYLIKQLKL
jgi:hypothetical protein